MNSIEWSKAVRKRDDYTCQFCGRPKNKEHAHHIIPVHLAPWLEFEVDNRLTLCASCHQEWHYIDKDYLIIADIMQYLHIY